MPYDIRGDRRGPAGVLSNLTPRAFVVNSWLTINKYNCASMEGFLQSLKFEDPVQAYQVRQMAGLEAKEFGGKQGKGWKRRGLLHFDGQNFERDREVYQTLLRFAYKDMHDQCPEFREALLATGLERLTHSVGHHDIYETVLTEQEFCEILTNLRSVAQGRSAAPRR